MKYVKIPGRTYKSSDVEKYERMKEELQDEANKWKSDLPEPELNYTESYACVPLQDLQGCIFEPASYGEEEDEAFETGQLKRSVITTKAGNIYSSSWSIKELVKHLIKWGIVHHEFAKEV